jgi:hypothetical protein
VEQAGPGDLHKVRVGTAALDGADFQHQGLQWSKRGATRGDK